MTYNVTDSQGHAATEVTRTVNVVDTTAPVITLLGSTPIDVEAGTVYVDAGATAWDNLDGDLTGSIFTVNPVNTAIVGTYTVTYNVTDSQGNAAPPSPASSTSSTPPPPSSPCWVHPDRCRSRHGLCRRRSHRLGRCDGDLTAAIVTVNPVNTAILGTYTVTYNVTDSQGNAAAEVTRTVNVVDTTAPVITLIGTEPDQTSKPAPSTSSRGHRLGQPRR